MFFINMNNIDRIIKIDMICLNQGIMNIFQRNYMVLDVILFFIYGMREPFPLGTIIAFHL